jgi:hypothetical protein
MRNYVLILFGLLVIASLGLDVWQHRGASLMPGHAFDVAMGALAMYLTPAPEHGVKKESDSPIP